MSPSKPTDDSRQQLITNAEDQDTAPQVEQQNEGSPGADAELDLESLDLTVEPIEERISPGETNVFDK